MNKAATYFFAAALGCSLIVSAFPAVTAGAQGKDGTPYAADGSYDVSAEHVLVDQVFGASDDAEAVSHSFIELYNPTDTDVSLGGWYLYYKSSPDGADNDAWKELALEGVIGAGKSFLVRCGKVDVLSNTALLIPEGDMEWDIRLHNKGVAVALFSERAELDGFADAVTEENRPAGYVDLLAVQGNDAEDAQIPPAYEGSYADIQSKKKAVRRKDHADTDNNAADAAALDYTEVTPEDKPVANGKGETVSRQESYVVKEDGFEADAALGVVKKDGIRLGDANADGGVAEIVSYNADNKKAYVVNGAASILNVFDVREDGSFGEAEKLDVAALMREKDPSFVYGDMTSVAVDTVNDRIAVALQDADYSKAGRIALLDYDNEIAAVYETGVQPDMIVFAADGRYVLTADEGEPRMGYGADAVDPAGTVTIVDTQAKENAVRIAGFADFDAGQLAAKGVVFNADESGDPLPAANDLEPEYIAVSGNTAYVALQEANAVAVLDLEAGAFTAVEPLGFKDHGSEENAVDLDDADGAYLPKTYENTYGVYMPDGITVYEKDGRTYLLTANEGDAREWGDFTDEEKRTLTSADGAVTAEKVRVLDNTVKAGIGDGNYLYGARSFSIFEVTDNGLALVYDSANGFEAKTWELLSRYYNVSNDDVELESRTAKKGVEPEAVALAAVGGRTYALIALERIGGIMIYDVTDPAEAKYVNYINTRDFNGATEGDVAPEGLAVIEQGDTALLIAAFEGSGTVASYELTAAEPEPEPEPEPRQPANDGAVGWIVGGCAAAVVLIGAIVAVVLIRRRK